MSYCHSLIGSCWLKLGDFKKALESQFKVLEINKFTKNPIDLKVAYEDLYHIYKQQGKTGLALSYYEQFIVLRDSLERKEIEENTNYLNAIHSNEKLEQKIELLDTEKKFVKAENDKQKTIIYFSISALALLLLLSFFIIRTNRQRKRANALLNIKNQEIQFQKEVIEEKQKEVLDSIHYAKRIQKALLPQNKYIERILNKHKKPDF